MKKTVEIVVPQAKLLDHKISLPEWLILSTIFREKKYVSARGISSLYLGAIGDVRAARRLLQSLEDKGYVEITENTSISDTRVKCYILTNIGKGVFVDAIEEYSLTEYDNGLEVINTWNSLECTTTHFVADYGKGQTKLVVSVILYVRDILNQSYNKIENCPEYILDSPVVISLDEICECIRSYSKMWRKGYLPADKSKLPTSLSNFFFHYRSGHSLFFDIHKDGVQEDTKTVDYLKGKISGKMLAKSYKTLSSTGVPTEVEKLEIQKALSRLYKLWKSHREDLDDIYSWMSSYKVNVMDFNMFVLNMMSYIDREVGPGNAKPGYTSFREGNKVMEGYAKFLADSFGFHLFPTEKQKEQIKKIRGK